MLSLSQKDREIIIRALEHYECESANVEYYLQTAYHPSAEVRELLNRIRVENFKYEN